MKKKISVALLLFSQFLWAESHDVLVFLKPPFPKKLSQWNLFIKEGKKIKLNKRVVPYDIVNPLFSDYALKFRTLWIPEGKRIKYREDHTLLYPEGTVLTKTFSYPRDKIYFFSEKKTSLSLFDGYLERFNQEFLLETRILVKTKKKWYSIPYVWNSEQTDADLALIGKSFHIKIDHEEIGQKEFTYEVPNMNQCISCHQEIENFKKTFKPIGVKLSRNLNKKFSYKRGNLNQLQNLKEKELIEGLPDLSAVPTVDLWTDLSVPLEKRARAHLDINCAHCHNSKGSANTSGLYLNLENKNKTSYGFCKQPVAAGKGTEGGKFDINPGNPHDSVLYLRLKSKDPSVRMPELGRHLVHKKGVELIYHWIFNLEGSCKEGGVKSF